MKDKVYRIALLVTLFIAVGLLSACGANPNEVSPVEAEAFAHDVDPIVEDVFVGLSEGDYAQHSRHFDEEFKEQIDEIVVFPQVYDEIVGTVGTYRNHEMTSVIDDGRYRIVTYDVAFADDPHVEARVFFWKGDPDHRIAGLAFDSPGLRDS